MSLRQVVHWKHSNWFIAVLISIWWALMGMHRFTTAFIALAMLTIWAVLSWWSSKIVEDKRPTKKRLKNFSDARRRRAFWDFYLWRWGGIAVIIACAVVGGYENYQFKIDYELSLLYGHLYPSNEVVATPCKVEDDEVSILMGYFGAKSSSKLPLKVIEIAGQPVLFLDRDKDGSVAITVDIKNNDNKMIVRLTKNEFQVNPNNYFSMKRADRSTLLVEDQEGKEVLFAHLANRHVLQLRAHIFSNGKLVETEHIPTDGLCMVVPGGLDGATVLGTNRGIRE